MERKRGDLSVLTLARAGELESFDSGLLRSTQQHGTLPQKTGVRQHRLNRSWKGPLTPVPRPRNKELRYPILSYLDYAIRVSIRLTCGGR